MRGERRYDRDEYGEPRRGSGGGKNTPLLLIGCVIAALVVVAVGGTAAWYFLADRGETQGAVIERYRPRFAEHRAKLKRIGANLPGSGSVRGDTLPANLDPKPVYDVPNKTFNTAILMAANCEDPDRELKSPGEFDLLFHEDEYRTHLQWTGDRNPMVESARKTRQKGLPERMERSLDLRYLAVARPVSYDPPRVVNENTFTGGELDLEVFLVDLRTEKVLGGFRRSFRPEARVLVEFRQDRKENESAEAFVHSSVWTKARKEVAATLARGTGGTFVIDKTK
jgi:hypothetical protein